MADRNSILEKYIQSVLETGQDPVSVYAFCKKHKWKEEDFFESLSSFDAVKSWFWVSVFNDARNMLDADKTYATYGFAEKLSAFYFLWTQQLLSHRSYVLTFKHEKMQSVSPFNASLKAFKKEFQSYSKSLVGEGVNKGELADRKFLTDRFSDAIWLQTLFLLNFWLNDESENFEATDAAIEKSVALLAKILGENLLDQAFDFGKFLFQNMKSRM